MCPSDTGIDCGGRDRLTADFIRELCEVRGEPALTTEEIANVAAKSDRVVEAELDRITHENELQRVEYKDGTVVWFTSEY